MLVLLPVYDIVYDIVHVLSR